MSKNITEPIFIIMMFFIFIFSHISHADNRSGFVCGKFNKNIIEVPSKYARLFVEYEGYSYFDKRHIYNKTGCEANFTVLPLAFKWPEMTPTDEFRWQSKDEGILISLTPIVNSSATMEDIKNNYLDFPYLGKRGGILYDDENDLYFVEYVRTIEFYSQGKSESYQDRNRVYWYEKNGEVTHVTLCSWLYLERKYFKCEINVRIPEFGIAYKIRLAYNLLPQWESMVEKSKLFITEHIKN